MVPIRIAAQLTATGFDGVRWVLIDADEGGTKPHIEWPAAADPDPCTGRRKTLRWLLQAAVIVVALVAASLTTRALLGRVAPGPGEQARTAPAVQALEASAARGPVAVAAPAASAASAAQAIESTPAEPALSPVVPLALPSPSSAP